MTALLDTQEGPQSYAGQTLHAGRPTITHTRTHEGAYIRWVGVPKQWIGSPNNGPTALWGIFLVSHKVFTKLVIGIHSKGRNFEGILIRRKEKYFI